LDEAESRPECGSDGEVEHKETEEPTRSHEGHDAQAEEKWQQRVVLRDSERSLNERTYSENTVEQNSTISPRRKNTNVEI